MCAKTSSSLVRFGTLLALCLLAGQVFATDPVRFFAIGDVPYAEREHLLLNRLLEQELPRGTPFLVHVGDIKAGSSPCTEAALVRIAELFRSLSVPVVYTPGDNEWTDCRRRAAGGYDPMERLALLRRLFYMDPAVLRLASLGVGERDGGYPENVHFLHRGVLFATVHVVGSRNNRKPREPAAVAEYEQRTAANRHHLRRVSEVAKRANTRALVLLFHANAELELDSPPQAYAAIREDLLGLLRTYQGPVLAIHGDTHKYRFDRPLRDPVTSEPYARFMRLEVPGSPVVGGVWVTVDPVSEKPFQVEPAYPDPREVLMDE